MKDINDFKLTAKVSVGQAKAWIAAADESAKISLLELIEHRFINRYLKHLNHPDIDGGFFKMAICCLMIETLESFKQGKPNTKGISEDIFVAFFESEQQAFPNFNSISNDFYKSIRCGILHQAETTNAWRIHTKGPLLDTANRIINATAFVKALELTFKIYLESLRESNLADAVWKRAIVKIESICKNCEIIN